MTEPELTQTNGVKNKKEILMDSNFGTVITWQTHPLQIFFTQPIPTHEQRITPKHQKSLFTPLS
jgi:hypothetical protein